MLPLLPRGAAAAMGTDPDWPCMQRLVPELAAGQLWGATSLDDLPEGAKLAPALEQLPARLADRSLPTDEAQRLVEAALAQVPEAERTTQGALLFRETLRIINGQRGTMIVGIKRYAQRQQALAEKINQDGRKLVELRRDPARAEAQLELTSERRWDMRVFDERQRSLRAVCDQPVLLEQRAFAIARLIQGELQ
jgi:hypothetical protein